MNNVMKGFVLAAVILYMVSPLDVVPGPIDDILVLALGLAARKRIAEAE